MTSLPAQTAGYLLNKSSDGDPPQVQNQSKDIREMEKSRSHVPRASNSPLQRKSRGLTRLSSSSMIFSPESPSQRRKTPETSSKWLDTEKVNCIRELEDILQSLSQWEKSRAEQKSNASTAA